MKQSTLRRSLLFLVITTVFSPVSAIPQQPRPLTQEQALRKQAWDILWKGTHETDTDKRSKAVGALGLLHRNPTVVRLVEDKLQDRNSSVRAAAATALGEMHSAASIPKLEITMEDKDLSVALAAARSLLLLNQRTGYDVYYAVLTGRLKSGQSLLAQQLDQMSTPKKLAEFAFDQGIGFLPYAGYGLEVVQALTRKNSSPLRAAAARILANDSDPRSSQALAAACSDRHWIVRVAALRAIAIKGNPALLRDITPAMQDNVDLVRYTAAAAILRLTWSS